MPVLKALLITLALTTGYSQVSQAYFIAVPKAQGPLDYARVTRVIVSGRGGTLGMQPQQSALGTALLYRRNFADQQLVLMSVFEDTQNEAAVVKAGWKILAKNEIKFETKTLVPELKKFSKIRSLEFFGHNSPSLGTQTDGPGYRFDATEPIVATLAPNFDRGAYAIIHGCNSGWIIAQELSRSWKIAVAGSFTGTRFERLHTDGHFYVDEDGRYPNAKWATRNDDLGGISCDSGACLRMRPAFSPYNGEWGDLDGPILSHYKFFCQLDVNDCEKRMASSLYGYLVEKSLTPRSGLNEFREAAKQYLCPVYKVRTIVEDCYAQLELIERGRGNMSVSYVVNAKQLLCNLHGCPEVMTCDNAKHACSIADRVSKDAHTLAEEYLHFLSGFELLQKEGL
jgi:hypothetical protein